MNLLDKLTVVSITYNNEGINNTINSVLPILDNGASMLIQNGGSSINISSIKIELFNEKDKGIYDAINKGISKVQTEYFMLIHAGDQFIGTPAQLNTIIYDLKLTNKSMSLNSQYIGKRLHSSKLWHPFLLRFGVQPPHLPTVYSTKFFQPISYDTSIPIIADFHFFNTIPWDSYVSHNYKLIQMETGGATSNGIKSAFKVSRLFYKTYGLRGILMAIGRLPFKIIQSLF
jgi:glycosyltransferase involved in cell wall biosynthesis